MRAEELQRMDADREARRSVVGEHPLPDRRLGELWSDCRRVERQGELFLLSTRPRHALRPGDETQLPQELTPRPLEAVAGAGDDQRFEPVARELRPLRQVTDARERPTSALRDDSLRLLLADPVD